MIRVRAINIDNLQQARQEIGMIGADEGGLRWMAPKAVHRVIKVENIKLPAAIIMKEEMLGKGGEAALNRAAGNLKTETTDVLLMGTVKQFNEMVSKLKMQPFGLRQVAEKLAGILQNLEGCGISEINCRGHKLPLGERTLIMGILNVTPDSFSDGGKFSDIDKAVQHAREMVALGADIIDLGGESTRPMHEPLSLDDELSRVIPAVRRLVAEVDVPISIDTYKAEVAGQALQAGAHMINDIWGLRADPDMAKTVAQYDDVPLIMMHNQNGTDYNSMMDDILAWLQESIDMALAAGVRKENLILDPGIGFGKTTEQNLEVMKRLWEFKALGYPVLLGTSRKSMIGNTLDLPPAERVEGTAATVTFGIAQGMDIVRVHDIKEMVRVVRMTDAMYRR